MTLVPDPVTTVPAVPLGPRDADQDPVEVYLARLGAGSRRTMREALDTVAGLLTDGRVDAERLPWWELRYQGSSQDKAETRSWERSPRSAGVRTVEQLDRPERDSKLQRSRVL